MALCILLPTAPSVPRPVPNHTMKIIATIAAALMAIAGVAATADQTLRQLIVGGTDVPNGKKLFISGVRPSVDGSNDCAGALVAPSFVLTAATCILNGNLAYLYVSVGSRHVQGTVDGEQIKVVSVRNHTQHNSNFSLYNFALLTLERPSKVKPVNLPNPSDSDIIIGLRAKLFGWGTRLYNGPLNQEMQTVSLVLWDNEGCRGVYKNGISDSVVCAGGQHKYDMCLSDTGSVLIMEKAQTDDDDILIALGIYNSNCGLRDGEPSIFARVSFAVNWINKVIQCGANQRCISDIS